MLSQSEIPRNFRPVSRVTILFQSVMKCEAAWALPPVAACDDLLVRVERRLDDVYATLKCLRVKPSCQAFVGRQIVGDRETGGHLRARGLLQAKRLHEAFDGSRWLLDARDARVDVDQQTDAFLGRSYDLNTHSLKGRRGRSLVSEDGNRARFRISGHIHAVLRRVVHDDVQGERDRDEATGRGDDIHAWQTESLGLEPSLRLHLRGLRRLSPAALSER